ncbi:18257_t:CDS:2 [Rhizophagus irregularis]|nr:18257_t:CDS:2 [Rhizophagus irregularis]
MSSSVFYRHRVFINSNDPGIHNQIIDGTQPIIKLPFPPYIDPYDLIIKSQDGKIPSRSPNAFIIYRKVFIETARNEGYILPMTVISSMASQSWERESEEVKEEYKRLSREAFDIRNEMLPKEKRKRKRGKWNIISFEKSKRSRKNPVQSPSHQEITNSTSNISPVNFNFDFTQYMNNMIPSPEIPEMYNSPGSSIISSPEINDYTPPAENNLVETPILYEEELFNLMPINNEIRNTEQFFNYNFDESQINPTFSTIYEPSELNFNFYHY